MHFHICPTEITALIVMWESLSLYAVHYKHIMLAQWHSAKCKVCVQRGNNDRAMKGI